MLLLLLSNLHADNSSQIFLDHHDQDPWVVLSNPEYPNQALAMTREENDKNTNPYLDISCSLPSHERDGEEFDMSLTGSHTFKAENDLWIDILVRVDEKSPIRMGWNIFEGREKRLEASSPNLVLSDLIDGTRLHLKFRDAELGLLEYTYGLKNLSSAIKKLEEICKYKYDGS